MDQDQTKELSSLPELGTPALLEYFWASRCDVRLFHFVVDVVLRGDYIGFVAKKALDGETDYESVTPEELARSKPGPLTRALRQSRQELLEMILSRAVDNFQVYLVDVIRLALHKQPRILSERKQELTLGHILKFDSIESLTRDIIEGKLTALSYEGFGELENWCQGKAIPLLVPDGKRATVVELIALRNIIVHGRGAVDERYIAAVPSTSLKIGEKRGLDVDDLFGAIMLLDSVVKLTDNAIVGKFGIEQQRIAEEIKRKSKQRWPHPPKDNVLQAKGDTKQAFPDPDSSGV